jgi:pimeloyl-ACP methyl ester carboxylesterase
MYENRISTATLGGHGLGGKVALAAACYHYDKVTGYFGLDSAPMNQYYHESVRELRKYLNFLETLNINRPYASIKTDLQSNVLCPKWRNLFLAALARGEGNQYSWNFNFDSVHHNLTTEIPSNLTNWHKSIGLYPGRSMFAFPEYSRYVHLSTNTLPMYSVCPGLEGLNLDIFAIKGVENPLNHWVYDL